MPISGWVVTLSDDEGMSAEALMTMQGDARFTLGERVGLKQPVVVETESLGESKALWKTVEALDGVHWLELAYLDFSDVEDFEPAKLQRVENEGVGG